MNYKERMNEIRTINDISQKEIAKVLGISAYTYSHYETADTIIPLKHLIACCDYFKVSVDYILNLTNQKKYANSNKEYNLIVSGNRLKAFRKENKITQNTLAKKINIARSMLSEYEKGHYLISIHCLYSICKKYNISADYLLGRIDSPIYLK